MNLNVDVSIIVPMFNVEKYIDRCIESLLKIKSNASYEIILVNDGSTDNTEKRCEKYLSKQVRLVNKENGGLSSARNAGINVARGQYLGFVDSDDWVESIGYGHMMDMALLYNVDIISGHYYESKEYKSNDTDKVFTNKYKIYSDDDLKKYYLQSGIIGGETEYSVCNKLYKKELFSEIKFPEGQLYEDMVTNYMIISNARSLYKIDDIVYYYFVNTRSITMSSFSKKDLDSLRIVQEQFRKMSVTEMNPSIAKLLKQQEAKIELSIVRKIILFGCSNEFDEKAILKSENDKLKEYKSVLRQIEFNTKKKIENYIICSGLFMLTLIYQVHKVIRWKNGR